MTLQIEDILTAVCTEVKLSAGNDYQQIYALSSDIEAKLAFDILVALGFNVKVYHTPEKPSKLYITNQPPVTPEQLSQRLPVALAYAHSLKSIKTTLDTLCRTDIGIDNAAVAHSYTVTFVNAQPSGKQILIQLSHAPSETALISDSPPAAPSSASSTSASGAAIATKAATGPITASSARVIKKRKVKEEDGLAAGPAVGRGLYPGKMGSEDATKKQTLRKRIMLRIFGNFATSGFATLMWLVIVAVVFSCFVFAKGFLCYDFVAKKSNKWYCKDPGVVSEEDARKAEQRERQKALGLVAPDETKQ